MLARSDLVSTRSTARKNPLAPRVASSSFFFATLLALGIVGGFAAVSESSRHWFLIPVFVCGILIGGDALDWLRGRLDVFDAAGLVGLLGFHFFFLAPLLHVTRDYWMPEIVPPADWREWIGYMAGLNAIGLLVYLGARRGFKRDKRPLTNQTIWQIEPQRFWIIITLALATSALLQIWIYTRFGGIAGYITAIVEPSGTGAAQGLGWLFTLAETFPLFSIMAWAVYAREKKIGRSWWAILLVLLAYFVIALLFGGLRGSRSNTIWGLLCAVGIIHAWIRPFPRKLILIGGVLFFLFMYFYGFFKAAGLEGLQAIGDADTRDQIIAVSGRNLDYVILGDLGRSDVQAYVLYRLSQPDSDYEYAWGRTYLGGIVSVIPSALWPDRPLTKVKEGTEVLYGAGTYQANEFWSSRQYGLSGEAMLNFGAVGVLVAFLVFALIVSRVQRFRLGKSSNDSRLLVFPALAISCLVIVATDSDNLMLYLFKQLFIPFTILLLSVRVSSVEFAASDPFRQPVREIP